VNKAIQDAIAEGEQELLAKKEADRVRTLEQARELARLYDDQYAKAEVWAAVELPQLIREATARGERSLRIDQFRARACETLGLKVESYYVEGWNDEGARFGDYWAYEVKW